MADATQVFLNKLLAYQTDYAAQGISAEINADPAGASAIIDNGSGRSDGNGT